MAGNGISFKHSKDKNKKDKISIIQIVDRDIKEVKIKADKLQEEIVEIQNKIRFLF